MAAVSASSAPPAPANVPRGWWLVLALGLALFALRLAGPADLTDNDQERPTSYVLDAVQNGNWSVQRDAYDDVASKPPLLTWLAGAAAVAGGRLDRLTLYLPSALAVLGTALLINTAGGMAFGRLAGLLGALSFLFCSYGFKHVVLARNDALFAFTVALAALAACAAWMRGRGWTWFWLAAALATLTKGPLGVLLAAGGLLALPWERRHGTPLPLRGRLWPGALLWLGVVGGWFALAYLNAGDDLLRKQLGRELAGHLTGASAGGKWPGADPFHSLLYFLSRYAPWSLAAVAGFWRVWQHPASEPTERRFERTLFAWFAVGLAVFTFAPHKRPDLLLPIIPAAAMLAGRELTGWLRRFRPATVWRGALVFGVGTVAVLALVRPQGRDTAGEVVTTRAMQTIAQSCAGAALAEVPLTFVEETLSVQFYLNRHQLVVSPKHAAALLLGEPACRLVTRDLAAIRQHLPVEVAPVVLASAPADGKPLVWVVSNRRPDPLASGGPTAIGVGPLTARLDGATFLQARRHDLVLRRSRPDAVVEVVNTSGRPVTAGVVWAEDPGRPAERRTLAPGESWFPTAR
jgi:4-amino-4-deoxy-L-arabinose transferase-like glycosyltransferase